MGAFSLDCVADAAGVLADLGGYSSSFRLFHMMIPFHKDETMLLLFCQVLRGLPEIVSPVVVASGWRNGRVAGCDPGALSKRYIATVLHATGAIDYAALSSLLRRSS